VITLDTSAVVVLADSTAPQHRTLVSWLAAEHGPRLLPAEILGETTYMLTSRVGRAAVALLLDGLIGRTIDCEGDTVSRLPRIAELLARYADLSLDFCDAAVVACAEAHGGRVLSLHRRDFDVIAGEGRITVLP
jgi:predicted nucleic acid-binding protein